MATSWSKTQGHETTKRKALSRAVRGWRSSKPPATYILWKSAQAQDDGATESESKMSLKTSLRTDTGCVFWVSYSFLMFLTCCRTPPLFHRSAAGLRASWDWLELLDRRRCELPCASAAGWGRAGTWQSSNAKHNMAMAQTYQPYGWLILTMKNDDVYWFLMVVP